MSDYTGTGLLGFSSSTTLAASYITTGSGLLSFANNRSKKVPSYNKSATGLLSFGGTASSYYKYIYSYSATGLLSFASTNITNLSLSTVCKAWGTVTLAEWCK